MNYKILVCASVLFFCVSGCGLVDEVKTAEENVRKEKVWAFIQFNVPSETTPIDSYYYYGKISKSLYEKISDNTVKRGFILLEKVKYWGGDDLIYAYQDIEHEGSLLFRIEDIRKMNLVNKEPKVGLGVEQFEEAVQVSAPNTTE